MERACDHMGENEVSRSWEYDGIGNVKKAVAGGFCYTYEYRPDGKLIKKSSSGRTLISCTYHADKSLKSLTDVSGKTVHYGYDSLGRLERICDDNGDEIVRYGHTAGGKLKEIRHGNGMHTCLLYTSLLLERLDMFSEQTEFYPNGSIKRLVLDAKKIGEHKVFMLNDKRFTNPYVSLEVVESLLRRGVVGIIWKEVEVEGWPN